MHIELTEEEIKTAQNVQKFYRMFFEYLIYIYILYIYIYIYIYIYTYIIQECN